MKRPADLMNSAARITTAFPTTGGATARTTAETTQTRRAAVSVGFPHFFPPPSLRFCSFANAADVPPARSDGGGSDTRVPPPTLPDAHAYYCTLVSAVFPFCSPLIRPDTTPFKGRSQHLCCCLQDTCARSSGFFFLFLSKRHPSYFQGPTHTRTHSHLFRVCISCSLCLHS